MNTTNMPGFTAEASLCKASEHYHRRSASAIMAFAPLLSHQALVTSSHGSW